MTNGGSGDGGKDISKLCKPLYLIVSLEISLREDNVALCSSQSMILYSP